MLDKMANKNALKKAMTEHLVKVAQDKWYNNKWVRGIGTGLSLASMAIPATWAVRGVAGAGMLARGLWMANRGKKVYQTAKALQATKNAANIKRGAELINKSKPLLSQGNKVKRTGQKLIGTRPVSSGPLKFKATNPATYPGAAFNTLTAPGGKGVMGVAGAGLGASYYGPQLYNAVTGGKGGAPGTPPPPPGPVPPAPGPTMKGGGSPVPVKPKVSLPRIKTTGAVAPPQPKSLKRIGPAPVSNKKVPLPRINE